MPRKTSSPTSLKSRSASSSDTSRSQESPEGTAARSIGRDLATRIGAHKYERWFGHATLRVHGRRLEVATDNQYVARWIDSHFAQELRGAAEEALGRGVTVDVRVAAERGGPAHGPNGNGNGNGDGSVDADRRDFAVAHGRGADSGRDTRTPANGSNRRRERGTRRRGASLRRLDEFVVGDSNRLAFSTARRLIEEPDGGNVSPLFIHGECGLGKTHLLQGICQRFAEVSGRQSHVRYVTGEQFTNEYIHSIRNNAVDEFRRRVRKLDLLAIDDVHFLSNKVRTQGEFLHTLDAIDLTGERIVLASDEHPRHIKRFSQALVSRFLSGMVVQIDTPDRETRVAIVQCLAAARSLTLGDAAVEAIASRCVGSVRELEGAITKLAALRQLSTERDAPTRDGRDGDVGIVLVEQLFAEHGWKPPTPVRLGTIIDTTCERLGIVRPDLMGSSRHQRVVLGRALVAFLGRSMTTHSYPEIARALGRPYHSTIHTAEQRLCRHLEEKRTFDPADGRNPMLMEELVDQLRHEITRRTV